MIKVYIASPYSKGDMGINVGNSMRCADKLIDLGFAPFCPLLLHFQHIMNPKDYNTCMRLDLEWLKQCDCLLRLPGKSKGADIEVKFAKKNNIPVFYDLDELLKWKTTTESAQVITDGENIWLKRCPECGKKTMEVVRPGKVQCSNCG